MGSFGGERRRPLREQCGRLPRWSGVNLPAAVASFGLGVFPRRRKLAWWCLGGAVFGFVMQWVLLFTLTLVAESWCRAPTCRRNFSAIDMNTWRCRVQSDHADGGAERR